MFIFVYRQGSLASLAAAFLMREHSGFFENFLRDNNLPRYPSPISPGIVISKQELLEFERSNFLKDKNASIVLIDTRFTRPAIERLKKTGNNIYILSPLENVGIIPNDENVTEISLQDEYPKSSVTLVLHLLKLKFTQVSSIYRHIAIYDDPSRAPFEEVREAKKFVMGYRHFFDISRGGFMILLEELTTRYSPLISKLIEFGTEFLEMAESDIRYIFNQNDVVRLKYEGFVVGVFNIPKRLASLVSKEQLEPYDFVFLYQDVGTRRMVELRTIREDIDLSKIASKFQGGGRPQASGFNLEIDEGMLFIQNHRLY